MYLEACLQKRCHFLPFVASDNGILDMEAADVLKRIAIRLATKWQQLYSRKCGYAKSIIAITLVQDTHWCIWGSRVPEHQISVKRLHWEDISGLNLFQ